MLTRGGLAGGIIFRSNNELQEVSRSHSTNVKTWEGLNNHKSLVNSQRRLV
ncbi:MAG: hypothetical protein ACI4HZ_10330 [Ruminococcus sp.]